MPTYRPAFYREQGGNRAVVASTGSLDVESGGEIDIEAGGRLEIAGTAFITSGGGVNLASLTSGDVTFPGLVTVSSGLAVTAASTFSAAVAFSSGIAVTGASTFSAGVTISSGLLVSAGSSFSTGIKVSGASTFAEAVAFSTGIAVTGASTFSTSVTISGGLTVSSGITATIGVKQTLQAGTSSGGALNGYGVSSIKSTAGAPVVFTIAPITGYPKWIYCQASCATTGAAIVTTTGTWDGSNANALFSTGNTNRQWLHAVATSTAAWQVFGFSTDVTFTNT